ncbi:MAG: ATP synthase F1 subunit epsilon [Candidatus Dojkabacteria bacterium]|nr:ATP synthase F1 subunit epsilon [Candidatus Dojkabacteria bacterium]
MEVKIISQTRELYTGEATNLLVPTLSGQLGVYPKHENLISVLDIGQIFIRTEEKEIKLIISGGFLQISDGNVVILADDAHYHDELIDKEIEIAIKRAEEKISRELPHADLIQAEKVLRYEKLKKQIIK